MTDRPLSIVYYAPSWPPGYGAPNGIVSYVSVMSEALRDRGHRVHVVSPEYPEIYQDKYFVPVKRPFEQLLFRAKEKLGLHQPYEDHDNQMARNIASAIRRIGEVDLFEMEESFGLCGRVDQIVDNACICRLHGPWYQALEQEGRTTENAEDSRRMAAEREWFRACEFVSAPTPIVMDGMKEHSQYEPMLNQVIPNPALQPSVKVAHENETCSNILFIGRIDRRKGADIALEAFGLIAEKHPDAILTIGGPDKGVEMGGRTQFFTDLLEQSVPEGARSRVHYLGPLSPAQVSEQRRYHGIALIPSRYENQGYTMVEAMSAGSLTLCADFEAASCFIEDQVNGMLFRAGDGRDLAEKLSFILQHPEYQRRWGAAARRYVFETLVASVVTEKMEDFYKEVLSRYQRS